MATLRPPLYKDFLTPALHRRFTGAGLIILVIAYIEAVIVGEKSSRKDQGFMCITVWPSNVPTVLWFWFPIGPAGIRTLLLFISGLSVFVLRVAQLHLGNAGIMESQCLDTETS